MYLSISSNNSKNLIACLIFSMTILVNSLTHAESSNTSETSKKRITTLWSDKEQCITEDAFMIAIEEYGDTYKVAACAQYGCRISVSEFGKKTHKINYRNDPKFTWITDTVFETKINGNNIRFYKCNI